jgi:predicted glycosyltransferase
VTAATVLGPEVDHPRRFPRAAPLSRQRMSTTDETGRSWESPAPSANRLRFILYSHDGLGLGHVRRNLAVAAALTAGAADASVIVATGADAADRLGIPPGVDVLKLPGLRKVDNDRYAARRLRVSSEDVCAVRSALLAAAVVAFGPSVMLVDKHPLGVGGELRPALDALRAAGGRAVLGLRDVLDDRASVRREWTNHDLARTVAAYYERVLIYGSRDILDPVAEYRLSASVAQRTSFCGYVLNRRADGGWDSDALPTLTRPRSRPVVLATAGGGEDGFGLLRTFIEAAAGAPWDAIVVAGPQSGKDDRQRLKRMAAETGVSFATFVPGLSAAFTVVDALVSMGGYNTLTEAAASGVPTVCVPRVVPRTEQLIRARAFARRGLLRLLEPERLNAETLRAEVACALSWSRERVARRAAAALGLEGAAAAARDLIELAQDSTRVPVVAVGAAR